MYDECNVYLHILRKNNRPVYSENLNSGQKIFKKVKFDYLVGLILRSYLLSEGIALVNNCIDISYTQYIVYRMITNFNNFQ